MAFKRKQIVILSLVLMIVIAGYLQYSYKASSVSTTDKETGKLGEAVYVDSTSAKSDEKTDKTTNKDVNASKQANDFFAQAKLDKEMARSKDTDSLKQITEDTNASKEAKDKAYNEMVGIIADAEKEMKIETLVKGKGFSDTVVLFGEDKSIDVYVKAPSLSSVEVAQISDIVARQANVEMTSIHIKNKY